MRGHELLAIDVAAEVATLCESQLQGPWQVPAELVRLARSRGAAGVEIRRCRGGFELACSEVVIGRGELADLATVLDDGARPQRRQDAIARLEAGGGTPLLWAAGTAKARLDVSCRSAEGSWGCSAARGRLRRTDVDRPGRGMPGTRVQWRTDRRTARRARRWLETALRFLPVPVELDGRPLPRGFPDGLYRMGVVDPLPAELVMTASGDLPVLWLLHDGVLSTRAVVPGYPAFSAAVELSGIAPPGAGPVELREAVNPFLPRLIDQAVTMMVRLVDRVPTAPEPVRRRITAIVLRSAALGLQRDRVLSLPLVPVRLVRERMMVRPDRLAALPKSPAGALPAVDPGRGMPSSGAAPIVVASAEERQLLSDLVGVRFELRGRSRSPARALTGLVEVLRRAGRTVAALCWHRRVDESDLGDGERRLVEASKGFGVELQLVRGAGPVGRRAGRWQLPRRRPSVVAAAAAVTIDPGWLYPALLAVGIGSDELPDDLPAAWLQDQLGARQGVEPVERTPAVPTDVS